jgi:hypothetical protein
VDETEVRVTLARVIPEREAWLYANKKALESVTRGIAQAKTRKFRKGPDRAKALADSIPDDDG